MKQEVIIHRPDGSTYTEVWDITPEPEPEPTPEYADLTEMAAAIKEGVDSI